ncbi:hypothetical protein CISG_09905 [Coccidioides immitis RMSCC 3703]|uniref:Uncharacterized protein n=1 Tax=Coccidioides immitis RMSCC 3703 TaxID=454286 RepID=A0A0J8QKV0_COCIT|nr:hypothetical protein CISG_09905 [Coccidioides immitis RMSCC 3703]
MAYFPFDSPVVTECVSFLSTDRWTEVLQIWETRRLDTRQQRTANQGKSYRSELREFQGQNAVAGHSAAFVDGANCHGNFPNCLDQTRQYSSVMLIPGKDKSPIRTSEK